MAKEHAIRQRETCDTPLCVGLPVRGERFCVVCFLNGQEKKKPKHKYRARSVVLDCQCLERDAGHPTTHRFASTAEGKHYQQLVLRWRAGELDELELQPEFPLHAPSGLLLGRYIADFRYREVLTGNRPVIDVKRKQTRTRIYLWKKKHAEDEHQIKIIEVHR